MSTPLVDRVVNAVLYEGYILYPYRPSVKNHQRWTFGGLLPEAYCRGQTGSDAASNQTQCLVEGGADTTLDVTVRFLHLIDRQVGELLAPLEAWSDGIEPAYRSVPELRVGGRVYHPWQEAEERRVELPEVRPGQARREAFHVPARRWQEPLRDEAGQVAGVLVREQRALAGMIEVNADPVADGRWRLTVRVANGTELAEAACRDQALLRALVSTHTILGVRGGTFVSLLDPPEPWRPAAADCRNVGTWPVLVGEAGQRDTLLSSPIILYDYPQVAPESPGDLFDSTEIDEILSLRILTLTDAEKQAAAATDDRTRELLQRTEALARAQLAGLHGTWRGTPARAGEDA